MSNMGCPTEQLFTGRWRSSTARDTFQKGIKDETERARGGGPGERYPSFALARPSPAISQPAKTAMARWGWKPGRVTSHFRTDYMFDRRYLWCCEGLQTGSFPFRRFTVGGKIAPRMESARATRPPFVLQAQMHPRRG